MLYIYIFISNLIISYPNYVIKISKYIWSITIKWPKSKFYTTNIIILKKNN